MRMHLMISLAAAALVAGCAHQQKPVEVAQAPAPVKAEPKPAPAPPPPVESMDAQAAKDLEAVLKGLVIHFEFDRSELSDGSRERLDRLATALRKLPKAKVRISGHCDERGTEEYNLALGHRRAEISRGYLVKLGVAEGQVETVSYGDQQPAAPGSNEEAWAQNRRAEFLRMAN